MFTVEELATIPLFSELGEKELEYLAGAVEDRHDISTGCEGALRPHRRRTAGGLPSEISRDEHGFVVTGTDAMKAGPWKADREPFALETSAPGIFAVGDIRSGSVKRVAASVGEGGVAIAFVHRYLQLPS